jgi:hypothetical protein
MAYVYDLDSDLGEVIIDNQGTEIIEFALGYDLEQFLAMLMSVNMVPTGDKVCDLRFGIREKDLTRDWKYTGLDYTQEKVRACVPAHGKNDVLNLLVQAADKLASATRFEKITMETYYQYLPPKAMVKYEMICNYLNNNGFSTETRFRSDEGTDYWLFSKNS